MRRRRARSGTVVYGVPAASLWQRLDEQMPRQKAVAALGPTAVAAGLMCAVIAGVGLSANWRVWSGPAGAGVILVVLLLAGRMLARRRVARAVAACRRTGDMRGIPDELGHLAWGAVAEEKVGQGLDRLGRGYVVIHDWQLTKGGRVRGNVDHLVITEQGALVMIDTKMWKGTLRAAGGRFYSRGDGGPKGYRGASVSTLRWAAAQLPVVPVLIVVAVYGRGEVADGQLWITDGDIPITAVHSRELRSLLREVRGPRSRGRVYAAFGVRRHWYRR